MNKQISFSFLNLILISILFIKSVYSLQTELAMLIEPGQRECFHQYLINDLTIESDYQVLSGGELDISFWISSPSNRVIFTEVKKQGGQTNFKTEEIGEYRFCFDNSFSRFSAKQVFFYLSTNDQFVDPHFPLASLQHAKPAIDNLGELDNKLDNFKELFNRVSVNLEKAQRFQKIFQGYELADRNVMEENFVKVNFWSVVNIIVMVTVGVVQVILIRSLFEDRSKIGRVLRGDKGQSRSYS